MSTHVSMRALSANGCQPIKQEEAAAAAAPVGRGWKAFRNSKAQSSQSLWTTQGGGPLPTFPLGVPVVGGHENVFQEQRCRAVGVANFSGYPLVAEVEGNTGALTRCGELQWLKREEIRSMRWMTMLICKREGLAELQTFCEHYALTREDLEDDEESAHELVVAAFERGAFENVAWLFHRCQLRISEHGLPLVVVAAMQNQKDRVKDCGWFWDLPQLHFRHLLSDQGRWIDRHDSFLCGNVLAQLLASRFCKIADIRWLLTKRLPGITAANLLAAKVQCPYPHPAPHWPHAHAQVSPLRALARSGNSALFAWAVKTFGVKRADWQPILDKAFLLFEGRDPARARYRRLYASLNSLPA